MRRSCSTWTVPMNPVPMTAARMSAIPLMGTPNGKGDG
jgi:hypothetical protein